MNVPDHAPQMARQKGRRSLQSGAAVENKILVQMHSALVRMGDSKNGSQTVARDEQLFVRGNDADSDPAGS